MSDTNSSPTTGTKRTAAQANLTTAQCTNKRCTTDPLIATGNHFARTVEMWALPAVILGHGVLREASDEPDSSYNDE